MKAVIKTSAGEFVATFTDKGLATLDFPTKKSGAATRAVPPEISSWVRLTGDALESVLNGRAPKRLPPLDWTGATDFRQRVWKALLEIPAGQTRSYGDIAESVGAAKGARAVGSACGANPIPVLVPCHRVLASSGKLGGFSGGLDWKRKLLAAEGALIT
jgi:O-6-methylguanine DNA methyltransferase